MKVRLMYMFEAILALFILVLKFVFIDKFTGYYKAIDILYWGLSLLIIYKLIGLKRDNRLVSQTATSYSVVSVLIYFIVIYVSGLFIGYVRCGYSLAITSIISNTLYLIIMIIAEELIRYMFVSNIEKNKLPIIILNLLYMILDFVLVFSMVNIESYLNTFIFITTTVLPIIARHLLFNYNARHVGYKCNIIIRLCMTLYVYILPIQPDLSYFLSSVMGLIYPYLVYLYMNYLYMSDEKVTKADRRLWYVKVPCTVIIITLVVLISGIFKYQIMAIGSGSMEPVYARGDAVIFEHVDSVDDYAVGDIVVFKHNNTYVTHRLMEIKYEEGEVVLQTKGDNNEIEDDFTVKESEVVGVVKASIKYIGYPSVWFQELIS